jgi:zinc transport system substrate-binding protein
MIPMSNSGRRRRTVPRLALSVAALLAAGTALAGCGSGTADDGRPKVVTAFYALEYAAQRVAGEHATVTNLTRPGMEPHDLELTVSETASVEDADVVVYEKGFQAAVDEAVDQADPAHAVDASAMATLDDDPHFWLDPTRLAEVAKDVEQALAEVDPANASAYRRNLTALQDDLHRLDEDFRQGLAACRTQTLVVSHEAFDYLADRYGLHIVAINGLSPDAEPSPAHLRQLQSLIRKDHITTVFTEELSSPELADTLASDLGIETGVLDPIEGLSKQTADQDYLSLMRHNLAAIEKASQC